MNNHAIVADNSKNMENLRNARSYNDVVMVLTAIKTTANSIKNRAMKNINTDPKFVFTDQTKSLINKFYADIFSLSVLEIEILFAKSLDSSTINSAKMAKFKKILDSTHNSIVIAQNSVYSALKSLVSDKIPSELETFVNNAEEFLQKILKFSGMQVVNMPSKDASGYISCIIVKNIYGPDEYILKDTLFCINAISNEDGSFRYTVSFPNKLGLDSSAFQFSNKRKLTALLKEHLVKLFNISDIKQLSNHSKSKITKLSGVNGVELNEGVLSVLLDSGLSGSEINNIITKLLSVLTSILGIDDPLKDVIHRMSVLSDGTKTIQFTLVDRAFYNTNALDDLRKMLNLKPKTYKELQVVAGVL